MQSGVAMRGNEGLALRCLGPLQIVRDGEPIPLPASRKVRALLAYLALARRPVTRAHLCALLWDRPGDPRGELRWSLCKLRAIVDAPGQPRLQADGDAVRLDLDDARFDVRELERAVQVSADRLDENPIDALLALARGDLLDGSDVPRSPPFTAWLLAERRRLRALQVGLLDTVAGRLEPGSDAQMACLEAWLQGAPFDRRGHRLLFEALARRGRIREGHQHLAALARAFDAERLDWAPLGHAWAAARRQWTGSPSSSSSLLPPMPGLVATASADARLPSACPGLPRASLIVMPFTGLGNAGPARGGLATALTHDVIARLARLRSLTVIAPGTAFTLDAVGIGASEAARRVNACYAASGVLRRCRDSLHLTAQLTEPRTARVLWADEYVVRQREVLTLLDELGDRLVAALDHEIGLVERERAIRTPPDALDAWTAHHRGLWHVYRFNRDDNRWARHWFKTAIRLDPTFSRPHSGLSLTWWEEAFLGWDDRGPAIREALASAERALTLDERDPSAHWTLGRAHWLMGHDQQALAGLRQSVALSPNFALGHYSLAFVNAQTGDARSAIIDADRSRALSPFDPLLFAMLSSRAIAMMRLDQFDEAANWLLRASAEPNAHSHIGALAAHCLALAGRVEEARDQVDQVQRRRPGYAIDDLLTAFRLPVTLVTRMRQVAKRIGMDRD